MNSVQDERHKLTQRLCTGYLDGHVVPQNCTSITKSFSYDIVTGV